MNSTKRTRGLMFALSLALSGLCLILPAALDSRGARTLAPETPRVQDAAREIDRLIQLDLDAEGLRPRPRADDGIFMRRVYLDVAGRIPSAAEARRFLDSKDPARREKLIDELLASPGRISREFNWWADLLRVKNRIGNQVSGEPYIDWLRQSLVANKPYDQMVRELLTASGAAHARDNGATGYLLRDFNMPHDNMANTMRLFMGTRIECAQCHDHPFEDWTQRQFFELAAFQGGLRYRATDLDFQEIRSFQQAARKIREEQGEQAFQYIRRQVLLVLLPGISGSGSGLEKLPKDYAYEDAAPGSFVSARAIMGDDVRMNVRAPRPLPQARRRPNQRANRGQRMPENDSRSVFAAWLTSPENPRFTTVIVNRLWERLMGRGLIDPVDDIKPSTTAVNFPLLGYLEDLMIALDYDMLAFQKAILLSRAYQREAVARDLVAGESYHFEGPLVRRLSAEQIWDSMLTLVVKDVDATISLATSASAEQVYRGYEEAAGKDLQQILAEAEKMGESGMSARQMARRRLGAVQREARQLIRELQVAQRRKDGAAAREIEAKLEAMGVDLDRLQITRRYGNDMLRASELRQPAPAGHFLRDFGQSDREQIDAGQRDATVPQVLNLLNGFLEDNLFKKRQGELLLSLRNAKSAEQRIRNAFVTVLSRRPDRAEIAMWRDEARKGGDEVWKDLIWTLANSHEFRFQR